MNKKAFDVVLWDIDGTLLDFIASEKAALFRCFESFGFGMCTDELHRQYSAINIRHWEMLERGEMTKMQILSGRFRCFFEEAGLPVEKAEAFNAEYENRLSDTIRFCDQAQETLDTLRGKVIQCAITNGTRHVQEKKLHDSGLDQILDQVFISDVIGVQKPDPAFFDAVCQAFPSVPKERMLIIGDSLTSDILGGIRSGIPTCHYNPSSAPGRPAIRPDYEIHHLSEVIPLILSP